MATSNKLVVHIITVERIEKAREELRIALVPFLSTKNGAVCDDCGAFISAAIQSLEVARFCVGIAHQVGAQPSASGQFAVDVLRKIGGVIQTLPSLRG